MTNCILCPNEAVHAWIIDTDERGWYGNGLKSNAIAWCDLCNSRMDLDKLSHSLDRAKLIRMEALSNAMAAWLRENPL